MTTLSPVTESSTTSTLPLPDDLLDRCRQRAATYDRENRFFDEDFAELGDAGYLLAVVPHSHGGAGATLAEMVDSQRRLAAFAPATALALTMHQYFTGIAADLHAIGDESATRILDEVAAGEVYAAGHAETGNDVPGVLSTTHAERVDGGYRVTGRKRFGSLGPVWTRLGIHAIDPADPSGPKIIHAFVPRDSSGVDVQQQWNTIGMRATQSYDTILDGVFVPDSRVIRVLPAGDPSDAYFGSMMAWAFLQIGAVYLGIADRALELAVGSATTKTSIAIERATMAHNPEIQHATAEIYLDVNVAAAMLRSAAADWSTGVQHPDWPARLLAAKQVAVVRAQHAVGLAMEVAGGAAISAGHELERLYRDVRCGWFNGMNGHLTHELIGKGVLGVEPQPRW